MSRLHILYEIAFISGNWAQTWEKSTVTQVYKILCCLNGTWQLGKQLLISKVFGQLGSRFLLQNRKCQTNNTFVLGNVGLL